MMERGSAQRLALSMTMSVTRLSASLFVTRRLPRESGCIYRVICISISIRLLLLRHIYLGRIVRLV